MTRPRLLLMPSVTEVEWTRTRPALEEWAEVASFDVPGVGEEVGSDGFDIPAVLDRALAEVEAVGWEKFVLVGDEVGATQAIRLAGRVPDSVEALALGHPVLSLRGDGDRAPLSGDVADAVVRLARTDPRSFVRALSQVTQNAYDDELAELYMERVGPSMVAAAMEALLSPEAREDLEPILRSLDVPMLLVEHKGCLLWSAEGFQDFSARFPEATAASMNVKPSVNPEFVALLRDFCASLPAYSEALADQP